MKDTKCIIKNSVTINNVEYYLLNELFTQNEFFIPTNQIDIFEGIRKNVPYTFIKEYNQNINKTFMTFVPPKYSIGKEVSFKVIDKIFTNDRIYFILKSEYKYRFSVEVFEWQQDLTSLICKVIGYKKGKPVLRNTDRTGSRWEIGKVEEFNVAGFDKYYDENRNVEIDAISVIISNSDTIKIRAGKWHKQDVWNYKTIECEIIGTTMRGFPKLKIVDKRHPHYEVGEIYEFTVVGFKDKILKSGTILKVIDIIDKYKIYYEVSMFPNQNKKLKINDTINCRVNDITSTLHLRQDDLGDPFYYKFEDIIDDVSIQKKYFENYLNDENKYNSKLNLQYTLKNAFWVFTYCNHILPSIKNELSKRNNLSEIKKVIDLNIKFEEWILNNGILQAINIQEQRKIIKRKTITIIEYNKIEKDVLDILIKFKVSDFLEKQKTKPDYKKIYYYLKHSDFLNINEIDFLSFIKNSKKVDIEAESSNQYFLKKIIRIIKNTMYGYEDSFQKDHFILSHNIDTIEKERITKYINWLYIEMTLTQLLNKKNIANLLLAKFYRYNTYLLNDYKKSKKLLLNAFHIINNLEDTKDGPIEYVKDSLVIDYSKLNNPINKIEKIDRSADFLKSHVSEKHYQGFKISVKGVNGFLPTQNIIDKNLKYYNISVIDWSTNIQVTLYCDEFNFFIAKQLPESSKYYYSTNNKSEKINVGDIIDGEVKNIKDYGVFVSTEIGDGLIHLKNISYSFYDFNNLSNIFKIGDKIPVFIREIGDDKIDLSFKDLIGTDFENKYYDIIKNKNEVDEFENVEFDEISTEQDNFSIEVEIEKGYIFEQYAVIQTSILKKIKYIKFAKAFFSNTKNARSYLFNIYIEYFNSLIKLDALIDNYDYSKYDKFRSEIIKIKEKVQPKTLENYPESKNLLFFIDILKYFNSKNEDDIESLFNLIRKPIEDNDIILKIVAKNALANNLIISEIEDIATNEINSFTLKNLRRIREYISVGVLSIKETIEDKKAKELREKRVYWKNTIKQDEGEKLEFKSTFITPVPSVEKNRIIEILENKISKEKDITKCNDLKNKIKEINLEAQNIKNIKNIIIHSALKTICAFANTNGGVLLLGVSDDKKIFGLEQDYNSFTKGNDRDEFGKLFDNKIKEYFGESFSSTILEKEFLKFQEGDILIVKVKQSSEEIFLLKNSKGQKEENLYVRDLSSSSKLTGVELIKFVKNKYREQILHSSIVKNKLQPSL